MGCEPPSDPGADPKLGAMYGGYPKTIGTSAGYSDEKKRAKLMTSMTALSFVCGISRFGTLRITMDQSFMNSYEFTGLKLDYHNLTHTGNGKNSVHKVTAWHVDVFCDLVNTLNSYQEGSGSVLDKSAIMLCSEGGGAGPDADTNGKRGGLSAHSPTNMATLIAGGAGGLKGGLHIDGKGRHAASVLLTGMRAVGSKSNLNDVKDVIDELL